MSRHASMSAEAIENRMNRDQTSPEDVRSAAEKITFSFEFAVDELKKLDAYPVTKARVERRVNELGNQLMLLAEYADEYAACFHVEEPPHSMRLHNVPADLVQDIVDELANDGEWLSIDEAQSVTYGTADLGTHSHFPIRVLPYAYWLRHGGTNPLSDPLTAYTWCSGCGEILSLDNDAAREAMPDFGGDQTPKGQAMIRKIEIETSQFDPNRRSSGLDGWVVDVYVEYPDALDGADDSELLEMASNEENGVRYVDARGTDAGEDENLPF